MTLFTLASGSEGNASVLVCGNTTLLIDNGLSVTELRARIKLMGLDLDALSAIVVTHEHKDHVGGVPGLCNFLRRRGLDVPVLMSKETQKAVDWGRHASFSEDVLELQLGSWNAIDRVRVLPITVPHDAAEPVAFVFEDHHGQRLGFATDLGSIPPALPKLFADCNAILMESNYDAEMLANGPHPFAVKRRVLSSVGHLGNLQTADFLSQMDSPRPRSFILAHLSRQNNTAAIAQTTTTEALKRRGMFFEIGVAEQDTPGRWEI